MKLQELARAANVSKNTIHYYIRMGLLPKPKMRSRNEAIYDDSYVEYIRFIKELQEKLYLPLAEIKKIVRRQKKKKTSFSETMHQLKSEYFRPMEGLLPVEIIGEEAFREATGLGPKWLAKTEEWGIITPEVRDGEKVYFQDDITLGKLIVDMDRVGLGPKDGFKPELLKNHCDVLRQTAVRAQKMYIQATLGELPPEEFSRRAIEHREIMSLYTYYLNRKLYRQVYKQLLKLFEKQKAEE